MDGKEIFSDGVCYIYQILISRDYNILPKLPVIKKRRLLQSVELNCQEISFNFIAGPVSLKDGLVHKYDAINITSVPVVKIVMHLDGQFNFSILNISK